MAFTTTDLIRSIKVKGQIPTSQNTFSTTDMLALADDEILTGIVPLIMSARESYFQATSDVTIVSGTAAYPIPERAIGDKLKEVQIVDASGNVSDLNRTEVESAAGYSTSSGQPSAFYLDGTDIVLVPTPNMSGYSLRLTYFRRPGTLVAITAAGTITAIDTALKQVTISSSPTTFTTSQTFDLVKAKPGFKTLAMDQAITAIGSNVITFTNALPSGLAVGDFVTLSTQSPVPQIPVEFHSVLALRVAVAILRSLGHEKEADSKQKELDKIEAAALGLISPRVEGEAKRIISTNGVLNPGGNLHPFFRS